MFFYLRFDLPVTSLVSLSVLQHLRILKVVCLVKHTFITKVRWLRLESEFRHKAGVWKLICVLAVHVIVVEMHVTSN